MSDDLVSEIYRPDGILPVTKETVSDLVKALTEARAEIEKLRAGVNGIVNCQGPMTRAQVREACAEILDNKTVGLNNQSPFAEAMLGYKARALAAESELSTLRARVREVVGGMLAHSCVADAGQDCKDEEDEAAERAARQLNEDLK